MKGTRYAGRRPLTVVAAILALACGSDSDPVGNPGSIQVTVEPAILSLEQGTGGSVAVTLTRTGGFSGAVTVGVSGLPEGVEAAVTPEQLPAGTTIATVTLGVDAATAPGTYTLTISASGAGVAQASITWQLTVSAAPGYALTVTTPTLTLAAGESAATTVNIQRTNFNGSITLALQNPPAGITGTFDPSPTTMNASELTVTVAGNVTPGIYALTIGGSAAGIGDRVTVLSLGVTPSPAGGNNVEYQFCGTADLPTFFAFQDGGSAWQRIPGTLSGGATRFAFNLTQGYGSVVIVYANSSSAAHVRSPGSAMDRHQLPMRASALRNPIRRRVTASTASARSVRTLDGSALGDTWYTEILQATTEEHAQVGIADCTAQGPTKLVTGSVSGVPVGAYGIVGFGFGTEIFTTGTTANPLTFEVPAGPQDLAGSLVTAPGSAPARLIVMRDLDIADGGSIPSPIDYDGPAAFTPATANVTISGGGGEDLETFVDLVTATSYVGMWFDLAPSHSAIRPWAGLTPAATRSGDLHGLVVFASPSDGSGDFRVALKYVGPVSNQTIALGPALAVPTTSQVAAGAYPRFQFQGALPGEYDKGATIDVVGNQGDGNIFSIIATGGWLAATGNTQAYDITMPDVAGLTGFPVAARLSAGINDVVASGYGFAGPGVLDLTPTLGGAFSAAVRNLTINVP